MAVLREASGVGGDGITAGSTAACPDAEAAAEPRTEVFISYARVDGAFAEWLRDQLIVSGFAAYLDRHDIKPGEPWRERLTALIETADAVLFVLSPSSIQSEACAWEVNEAERLNKRILPIVWRDVDDKRVPGGIRRLNYIHMRSQSEVTTGGPQVTAWLVEDLAWVREHTRLLRIASRWEAQARRQDLLLRGAELAEAALWVAQRPRDAPQPGKQHLALIGASRIAEQAGTEARRRELDAMDKAQNARARSQRRLAIALAAVAVAVVTGGVVTIWQVREINRQTSQLLAAKANDAYGQGRFDRALRFAVAAMPPAGGTLLDPWVPEAEIEGIRAAWASRLEARLTGHRAALWSIDVSPTGRQVATASEDRTAIVWEARTGRVLHVLEGHGGAVRAVRFSGDGRFIVTGSLDRTAIVWDAASGAMLAQTPMHTSGVLAVAFDGAGRLLATASLDGTLSMFAVDAAAGDIIASSISLGAHAGQIYDLALDPATGIIASAGADMLVKLWRPGVSEPLATLAGHLGVVRSVAFDPSGDRLVTASDDRSARIWDVAQRRELKRLTGHLDEVRAARFVDAGDRVATAGVDRTLRLWEASSGKELDDLRIEGFEGLILGLAVAPSGSLVASAGADGLGHVWRIEGLTSAASLTGHDSYIRAIAISSDSQRIVTGSNDRTARVWRTKEDAPPIVLAGHRELVVAADFSPDGCCIVTASTDGTVRIWNATTGVQVGVIDGHRGGAFAASFSADGRTIVTGAGDGIARLWDAGTLAPVGEFAGHSDAVRWVRLSRDGQRLLTASQDFSTRLWSVADGKELRRFTGHSRGVRFAAFLGDESRVVTASQDGTIRVWSAGTGRALTQITTTHSKEIVSAGLSGDGSVVVTASLDGTARLWHLATGREIARLGPQAGMFYAAAIDGDGGLIVAGGEDSKLRLWRNLRIDKHRGNALRDWICVEKLRGAQTMTAQEMQDSLVQSDAELRNPCGRRGMLRLPVWIRSVLGKVP